MKWLIFKLLLSIMFPLFALAETQESKNEKKSLLWKRLIPEYSKIQYAGSMGMLSVGTGWLYGKKHWETDILAGYTPTDSRRPDLFTLTLKQNYIPWWINLSEVVSIEPVVTGLYLNAIVNDRNLWASNPSRYPKNYYWHSNRYKLNIFLGQRLKFNLQANRSPIKSISAFYEISACDLYLIKAVTNKYLKPKDYISLSLGIRLGITH